MMRVMGLESLQNIEETRVKTPPVLHKDELDGLRENFRWFDRDGSGSVTLGELVESGLLDKETAARYMVEWDEDGTGEFDCEEFCQMLCPAGFRAFEHSEIGSDVEGNRVIYDTAGKCWVCVTD